MSRNYNSQGVQNSYQGSRVGENIGMGKLPSHYEMMTDFAWKNSNLGLIADVKRNVKGENFTFTQVLPATIFKQNRIDGVGTWGYSVVKDNTFKLTRMGYRYMNEIIPHGTWEWVKKDLGYQAEYFSKSAAALVNDEYETAFNVLSSRLPESTIDPADSPNLKTTILRDVADVEARTGIPRNFFILSLSRDALDSMTEEEISARNLYSGNLQEANKVADSNVWSVGNIVELPRGGHDTNVLYMIHVRELLKVVVFSPETPPGFYGLSERNGSPMNQRFVAEDGLTVDYFDANAGSIMKKSRVFAGMPEIQFISSNKTLEIPTNAAVTNATLKQYLIDNYGLAAFEYSLDKDKQGAPIDIDYIVVSTPSTLPATEEGISHIDIEVQSGLSTKVTKDRVAVFFKDGAVPPTEQVVARNAMQATNAKAAVKTAKVAKETAK